MAEAKQKRTWAEERAHFDSVANETYRALLIYVAKQLYQQMHVPDKTQATGPSCQ